MLDDPVPRVRRNAAHALGCVACKPVWEGGLSQDVMAKLAHLAAEDPNAKVRGEVQVALDTRPSAPAVRSWRGQLQPEPPTLVA